jgi:hypothetical protein
VTCFVREMTTFYEPKVSHGFKSIILVNWDNIFYCKRREIFSFSKCKTMSQHLGAISQIQISNNHVYSMLSHHSLSSFNSSISYFFLFIFCDALHILISISFVSLFAGQLFSFYKNPKEWGKQLNSFPKILFYFLKTLFKWDLKTPKELIFYFLLLFYFSDL